MRVVNEAGQDGIANSWIGHCDVPMLNRGLACHNCRVKLTAFVHHLKRSQQSTAESSVVPHPSRMRRSVLVSLGRNVGYEPSPRGHAIFGKELQ